MALPPVALRVCVGDLAVPLQGPEEHEILNGDTELLFELDLSSRACNHKYLEVPLGVPARSFNPSQWPLFLEIHETLTEIRNASFKSKRASKRTDLVLDVDIRGHRCLVKNSLKGLHLYLKKGEEVQELQWLIEELMKDLENLEEDSLRPHLRLLTPKDHKKNARRRPSSEASSAGEDSQNLEGFGGEASENQKGNDGEGQ